MNAVSGFVPSEGHVELFGKDVSPAGRTAGRGSVIGRAFQNARLFGSLTVRETLMVALEARQRSLFVPSVLALPPSPGRSAASARSPTRSSATSVSAATPTR
jgi:ABC-type branched-subunit amino acid transport system ATPase component